MTDKIVTGQRQAIIMWMTNILFCVQNPSLPGHPSCSSQAENTQNPCRLQQQPVVGEHAVFKMEKNLLLHFQKILGYFRVSTLF